MRNQSSSSFSSESREKISPLLSSSISATSFISFFESKTASSDIPSLVAALDNASLSKLLTIVQNRVDESSLYLASGGNSSSSSDSFVPPSENIDPSDIDSTLTSNSIGVAISLLNYSTRLLSNIFDILEAPPSSFIGLSSSSAPSPLPISFMETSISLHNSIAAIPATSKEGKACVSAIVRLCVRIYLSKGETATSLLPLTVFQLILDASSPSTGASDDASSSFLLKRLWTLASRGALAAFDYDDESCDALRDAILRSFSSGKVLSSSTGRNLLACFLTLCPSLTLASHGIIKSQFPAPIRVQDWYGAIYLRSWEESEGSARICVEETCLQDLLHCGVHAADPSTFEAVRRILSLFLQARDRKRKGIDAMLSRIALPILWRALECANAAVRRNAATFLKDAFPLGLSECPAQERDELVGRQLQALCAIADDDCPGVRQVGVASIGLALERFWETLPLQARLRLLERISARSEDGKAPSVRSAALLATSSLIENQPMCHSELLIRGFIPPLCKLIHDKSERVRVAAVKLLLSIERNHGILGAPLDLHIDSEQILARLVMDAHSPIIAEGLSKLLLRSFFPTDDVREKEILGSPAAAAAKRIIDGLRAWEMATLTFLTYLPRLSPRVVSKSLIVSIISKLHSAVHYAAESRVFQTNISSKHIDKRSSVDKGKVSDSGSINEQPLISTTTTSTMKEVSNILRAISTLWNGLDLGVTHQKGIYTAGRNEKELSTTTDVQDEETISEIDASTGAIVAGVIEEDACIQSRLISLFAGEEISFLIDAFCSSSLSNEVSGLSTSSASSIHTQSISASLLSIASHIPVEFATNALIVDSVWAQLYNLSPSEISRNGGSVLQPIILFLSSWGLIEKLIKEATKSLSNTVALIVRTIDSSSSKQHQQFTTRQRELTRLNSSTTSDELACTALLDASGDRNTMIHPIVAVCVLELCLAADSNRFMLTSVEDMKPIMASLADGVTALVPALQAKDSSSSAILIASIIAPACVRTWSRLTILQINSRKTAAEIVSSSTTVSKHEKDSLTIDMQSLASDNIRDFASWIVTSLLPSMLAVDTSDFCTTSSEQANAVLPLAAAYSVLDEIAALASDLLQGGMAVESALGLFHSLSSLNSSSSSKKSPFELCTDPNPLWTTSFSQLDHYSSSTFKVTSESIPRLHITLLRLGLRLYSASCGNILGKCVFNNSSVLAERPLVLPQASQSEIATIMGRLLCAGVFSDAATNIDDRDSNDKILKPSIGEDEDVNEEDVDEGFKKKSKRTTAASLKDKTKNDKNSDIGSNLIARQVTEQLVEEALKAHKRSQGVSRKRSNLSSLLEALLSVFEASIPARVVKDVFESKGDCIISVEDLHCHSAKTIIMACLGLSKTFKVPSSSLAWCKEVILESITERIKLLYPGDIIKLSLEDPVLRAVAIALAVDQVLPLGDFSEGITNIIARIF
jgi:hypothetical protein